MSDSARTKSIALPVAMIVLGAGLIEVGCTQSDPQSESRPEQAPAELTIEDGGDTYVVVDGDVFKVMRNGNHEFVEQLYDPEFFAKNYETRDGELFQRDLDSGRLYPVTRNFRDGFEDAASTDDLISVSRWHLNGTDPRRAGREYNYHDMGNRVTLSREVVHDGEAAVRFHARPSDLRVSKASISKTIMYFRKGDDVYFSGWFFVEDTPSVYDGGGFTLFDLESSFTKHIGLRIIIRVRDALAFELELPKTQFKQEKGSEISFPTGRWVHVETHAYLSDKAGRVQIWQDGVMVLAAEGRTLPLPDTVYDIFEIGINSIAKGCRYEKTVYVDDVVISDSPIRH